MTSVRTIGLVVEGQTEEAFVRDVLAPELAKRGTYVKCVVILKTKRTVTGHHKGGLVSTQQVLGDVGRLLTDTSLALVSTLLDLYGLPSDFPGFTSAPTNDPHARVHHIEAAFGNAVACARFLPNLVLHEFEAWLFSEPHTCCWVFEAAPVNLVAQMVLIRDRAGGPELINDGPSTHPSMRIQSMVPGYRKTLHGPTAVDATGLGAVAARCPHFDAWLSKL